MGINHGDEEVKGIVRIAHDEEQRGLPVSQGIQFKLVVGGQVPKLLDIKGGQSGAAGNQDGFRSLTRRQLVLFVLPHGKVLRLIFCKVIKE